MQYANYLHHQTLQSTEEVSSEDLLSLSKASKYNPEDEVMRYSSEAELEDHKKAFDAVLVKFTSLAILKPLAEIFTDKSTAICRS